jgi:hypothetical protein
MRTPAEDDAEAAIHCLRVGEVGEAVGTHALSELERLCFHLGQLPGGGLAIVGQKWLQWFIAWRKAGEPWLIPLNENVPWALGWG